MNKPGRKRIRMEWKRQKSPYAGMSDCIICTSHRGDKHGYVTMHRDGTDNQLHRIVCERRHGPLGKLHALHLCDVPACINPDHIIPGTPMENKRGCIERGRHNFGARNGLAKLTDENIRAIRLDNRAQRVIADDHGVTHGVIGKIKRGETWKHVDRNE
jgi:hypothetical protein